MNFLTKNCKWIVVAILLIISGIFLFRRCGTSPPPSPLTSPLVVHAFDSIKYIHKADSLQNIVITLEEKISQNENNFKYIVRSQQRKVDSVKNYTTPQVVAAFEQKTDSKLSMHDSNNVIAPVISIRRAVSLLVEGDNCKDNVSYYLRQDSLKNELISGKTDMIYLKDTRIASLTKEFYTSQGTIDKLNTDLDKAKRKVRTRNTIIGVVAGAAAVAVGIVILKP